MQTSLTEDCQYMSNEELYNSTINLGNTICSVTGALMIVKPAKDMLNGLVFKVSCETNQHTGRPIFLRLFIL